MRVEKYAFKENLLSKVAIFKLPEFSNTHIFVTEDFKKIVEENDIKGFKFEEL